MNWADVYRSCYEDKHYRMGADRMLDALNVLITWDDSSSLLDVGCGRGEFLAAAPECYTDVLGIEFVEALVDYKLIHRGVATDLRLDDNSFDVVSCLDVLEHIPEEDTLGVLSELKRVARKHALIAVNNQESPHRYGRQNIDLHITKKPYEEWHGIFAEQFHPGIVTKYPHTAQSHIWGIDF